MNRRDFFKTSAAAAIIPTFPASAGQLDLEMWMEENFNCKIGLAAPWVAEQLKKDEAYHYHTIALSMIEDDEAKAKRVLTENVIKWLEPMAVGKPELWWRTKPQFVVDTKIEYGDVWMSAEDYEDFPKSRNRWNITKKHNSWTKDYAVNDDGSPKIPENVKYDFLSHQYRYVKETQTAHKLRMRIAIPSKVQELAITATPEGAPIRTI